MDGLETCYGITETNGIPIPVVLGLWYSDPVALKGNFLTLMFVRNRLATAALGHRHCLRTVSFRR